MKSSDTSIMIEATRMLVKMMQGEGLSYPLHLGVTEAGEGEDGRIRSAAGIGALLAEGIGDTIRVSLSEDPEDEIPVAKKLVAYYPRGITEHSPGIPLTFKTPSSKPAIFKRINGPLVISNTTSFSELDAAGYLKAGYITDKISGEIKKSDSSADLLLVKDNPEIIPENAIIVLPYRIWYQKKDNERLYPLFSPETFHDSRYKSEKLNVLLTGSNFNIEYLKVPDPETTLLIFTFDPEKEKYAADYFLNALEENNLHHHIVLNPVFRENSTADLQIKLLLFLAGTLLTKELSEFLSQITGILTSGM